MLMWLVCVKVVKTSVIILAKDLVTEYILSMDFFFLTGWYPPRSADDELD